MSYITSMKLVNLLIELIKQVINCLLNNINNRKLIKFYISFLHGVYT